MNYRAIYLQVEIQRHLIELASIADDEGKSLHVDVNVEQVARTNLVTLVDIKFEEDEDE